MPKLSHHLEYDYTPSFRADAVASMFGVPPQEKLCRSWEVDLPLENMDWQIGLICGPSGCGKTSLAKALFPHSYHKGYEWGESSIMDDFPKSASVKDITKALSSVGFSSPPDWLRPHHTLSNGQQFRAEVARLLLDNENYPEIIVLDEFTSLVDRTVAKVSCAAVQRYIRSTNKKFIAVTCHSDIIDWLNPEWVYQPESGQFEDLTGRSERRVRFPDIELVIKRVGRKVWSHTGIGYHHYLDTTAIRSGHFWAAFWGETLVGMMAVVKLPHPKVKNAWRSSRTVVFPDFQGLRIGVEMNDAVAHYYCTELGMRFFASTSHPAMIAHRRNSPKWKIRRQASMAGKPSESSKLSGFSLNRALESCEYVGHLRG